MITFLNSFCTCFIVLTKKGIVLRHENITIITILGNNRSITSNHRSIWTSMKSKRAGIRTQTKVTWKKKIFFVNKDDLELWDCDALVIDYESHEVFTNDLISSFSQWWWSCREKQQKSDDLVFESSNGKLFLTFMEIITESARAWAKRRT